MNTDKTIAYALATIAGQTVSGETSSLGQVAKSVLAASTDDAVIAALESFIDSEGFEKASQMLYRQVIFQYLWRLAIAIDEQQSLNGNVLSIAVAEPDNCMAKKFSGGSIHEYIVEAARHMGVEW